MVWLNNEVKAEFTTVYPYAIFSPLKILGLLPSVYLELAFPLINKYL
jgi:hypothetical protein